VKDAAADPSAAPGAVADGPAETRDDRHGISLAKSGAVLGGIALLLWKLKVVIPFVLTKGKLLLAALPKMSGMLLGLGASLGLYWAAWGWQFAVGVIASIWIHEMGHVAAMRAYGIPASAPMFVPGLGAYIRMHRAPRDAREDARIGLAGPVGGLVAALASAGLWLTTGYPLFAAIAKFGAWVNIFNLVPVWQLDGARAFRAFSRFDRYLAILALGAGWLLARDGMLLLPMVVGFVRLFSPPPAPEERDGASVLLFAFLVLSFAALLTLPVPGLTRS
jgi:Zn-dependent protease